jgi:tetratricopeptide (TPR) repeat protein
MLVSGMSDSECQTFQEATTLHGSGRHEEAIQKLNELARTTVSPVDKAGVLYHEVLWLLEAGRISQARERFNDMQKQMSCIDGMTLDSQTPDLAVSLNVMTHFAEAKLLIAEGNESQASTVLENLSSRYPNQLSLPNFREISNEAQVLRGVLLADAGRWQDARSFLESASPPSGWEGFLNFYRGRSCYETSDFAEAKQRFLEALQFKMIPKWEAWTRYMLGRVYYHLSDFSAAKPQFESCLRVADSEFAATTKVLEWLESTTSALSSLDFPGTDRKTRGEPSSSIPN